MDINSIASLFSNADNLETYSKGLTEVTERLRRNIREIRDISMNTKTEFSNSRLKYLERQLRNNTNDILCFAEEIEKKTKKIKKKTEEIYGILDK